MNVHTWQGEGVYVSDVYITCQNKSVTLEFVFLLKPKYLVILLSLIYTKFHLDILEIMSLIFFLVSY